MSEDKVDNPVAKPVDVSAVADPVATDEKVHDDLVADVTKMLEGNETPDEPKTSEKPGEPEEPPKGETAKDGEGEKETDSLSKELQTLAKGAGLSEDLAQRLHDLGQLEETVAAFDRGLIDRFQSKEPTKDEEQREKEPPPDDQDSPTGEIPALDPDVYDEELVKRDAYQQRRIDALEAQLQELMEGQQGGFDEWFDGVLTDLGVDTSDNDKCQSVFQAYGAICDAFGTNANSRKSEMVQRAYAAMYPQDVFKQNQRQTVDRLRDAEGKFLSSSKSKGGPPPKDATDDEVQEHLVSNVTAYLKEQGVQMSGV